VKEGLNEYALPGSISNSPASQAMELKFTEFNPSKVFSFVFVSGV